MRLQSAIFVVEETLLHRREADKVLSLLRMESVWLYGVTALDREEAETALRAQGLWEGLRGLLTAGETRCPLGGGELYLRAMRRLRSTPRDTVVFAGRLASLRGAKSAGLRTAALGGEAAAEEWAQMTAEAEEALESYREFLG